MSEEKDVVTEAKEEKQDANKNTQQSKGKSNRSRSKNRNGQTNKGTASKQNTAAKAKSEELIDISPYISNVEGDVYAISGLSEEFIATLFAWVSRSSKSFKDQLRIALEQEGLMPQEQGNTFETLNEKAKKFHEKWTVGYGHSSVAEHATAHVGIEKISRLASAELELSNTFLSITEYSQRYQKPVRGGWVNSFPSILAGHPLDKPSLHEEVEAFYNEAFDAFETLIEAVLADLKKKYPDEKESVLEKLAFEDARYVLPLAMHTQLGMTANGRAWRDGIAKLGTSLYKESQELADNLRTEITKVLPVLLKYAEPSLYQKVSGARMRYTFDGVSKEEGNLPLAKLLSTKPEGRVIDEVIAYLYVEHEGRSFEEGLRFAEGKKKEEKEQIILDLLDQMAFFDVAPDVFRHATYKADFLVSEANWHQLLRHNRATEFTFGRPTVHLGITIPPRIKAAGLQDLVKDITEKAKVLYNDIRKSDFPELADYVVTNAHKRRVSATFSLWEAYHLINLRTSEEAQWDIRETFEELYQQMKSVHPTLVSRAQRRLEVK